MGGVVAVGEAVEQYVKHITFAMAFLCINHKAYCSYPCISTVHVVHTAACVRRVYADVCHVSLLAKIQPR